MQTKEDVIACCMQLTDVYEDYPFHNSNWAVLRHKGNKKIFACVYARQGNIWVNVKCAPGWRDFWRQKYEAVIPAYHMNKEHWNSVILDGTVAESDIRDMIGESYRLTAPKGK